MTFMDFPLLTMRTKTSLLIHSTNLKNWIAIATDKGLDYKTYNKNKKSKRYFSDEQWKKGIKKFRITQRNRCFGYVNNGIFYVLRFDLDHELSDVG